MSLTHARHNVEACDFLLASEGFNDWVITTAFYSSMYFVQYKLFPLTYKNNTYKNFGQYYKLTVGNSPNSINRYEAMKILISQRLPELNKDYRRLMELCHTSRYSNYQSSPAITSKAREHLAHIKQVCDPVIVEEKEPLLVGFLA